MTAPSLQLGDLRVELVADYVIKTLKCKPDKFTKMYNNDETKQLILAWFDKADNSSLMFVNNPGGLLSAQYEWPSNPRLKCCYFVKKTKEAVPKDVPFKQAVYYGDLSYAPIDQFSAFIDEVCWPSSWSVTKEKT